MEGNIERKMNLLEKKIYPLLPVWMQNIGISAYGLYWYRRRFGGIFREELRKFKDRENYTAQQWRDYQTVELRKLLCHAFETVPYYREKYSKLGFTVSQLSRFELEDLEKLPFLEKDDLRKYGTTTLLSSKRERGGRFYASSGSTGTPTQILISPVMHQKWSAGFEARIRHWAGVNYKIPRGMIGGRRIVPEGIANEPYYRYNTFEKQTYFSAYHISPLTVKSYIEGIKKHGVRYMTGYAMSNYLLARFIEKAGLEAPRLKAVITSSEKLTPVMRATFSKVYGCKTFDSYSGVEDCGLISECEYGSLHISPDLGILEFLDKESSETEICCTGLINFNQPLIRYRIGDSIKPSNKTGCLCGRDMPIIKEISGRNEDVITGKDGRQMVRFHSIFINIPKIIEAQVVQYSIEHIEIKLVTSEKLKESEISTIRERMWSQLGEIDIKITYVDKIPRNSNGKFKAVVSHVK